MFEVLSAVVPAVAGLSALLFVAWAKREQQRAWHAAALAAGLTDIHLERHYLVSSDILTARAGGRRVRIAHYSHGKEDRGIRIFVEGRSGLTLCREADAPAMDRLLGVRDVETGDEDFDRLVYVQGDPGVVRAVLDAPTRRAVRDFLEGPLILKGAMLESRATVRDGDVWFEHGKTLNALHAHFPELIEQLLGLLKRLESGSGVGLLIHQAANDPEWRVRLETFRLLAERYPRHPAAREALRRGCSDERQEVQLECALSLDDGGGRATLQDIASREWSDDPVAARAVAALGNALPADRALAILGHALRTRRHQTARACLEALGGSGQASVVDTLAKVMRVEKGPLAVAAARAMGASGAAAAEGPLLGALGSEIEDLRVAAAEALGHTGSPAAILALKEAAERDGRLRRVARQAIAGIQARKGVSPGQLSLAEGQAGEISLADDEPRGRLSVTNGS